MAFYRWHLADPIVFERSLRVTVQQIGMAAFTAGQEAELAAFREQTQTAGEGWRDNPRPPLLAMSLYERSDDWCATAFVYLQRPQPVPRLDRAAALADLPRATESGRHIVRRPSALEPS